MNATISFQTRDVEIIKKDRKEKVAHDYFLQTVYKQSFQVWAKCGLHHEIPFTFVKTRLSIMHASRNYYNFVFALQLFCNHNSDSNCYLKRLFCLNDFNAY